MKGQQPEQELLKLPPGVSAVRVVSLHIPLLDEARHLVVMQPVAPSH
jgi:16S rRNA (guanine527-N7)-methyltransferase